MTADEVQALVARCLVDPEFLPTRPDPDERGGSGRVAPGAALPTEALALFRGFITRIKHNGLRKIAPLTLRLLHAFNLEVAFFATIAPAYQQARGRGPLPLPRLFEDFEEQLNGYLPQVDPEKRSVLEAVLRHEGNVWRTAAKPIEEPLGPGPRLAPGARVAYFPIDVLGLCSQMSRDRLGPVPAADCRDQYLFYRRDGAGSRAFEIDAVSAAIISALDGRRSLAEVCDTAAADIDFLTPELVATLIEDAAGHGMVVTGAGADGG